MSQRTSRRIHNLGDVMDTGEVVEVNEGIEEQSDSFQVGYLRSFLIKKNAA